MEEEEEEGSFLQEVLSSLKTPLVSCSLSVGTEDLVLEREEEEMKEKEVVENRDGGEAKEDEAEVSESVGHQAAPSGPLLMCHTTEEDDEALPCQEEVVPIEDEAKGGEEDESEEEEELVVERFVLHDVCILDYLYSTLSDVVSCVCVA